MRTHALPVTGEEEGSLAQTPTLFAQNVTGWGGRPSPTSPAEGADSAALFPSAEMQPWLS